MLYTAPSTHPTCNNCPKTNPTQTIVVKVDRPDRQDLPALFQDAAQVVSQGHDLILVWGGEREQGLLPEMLGSRLSPSQAVSRLQGLGVNAMGLNGQDGRLIQVDSALDLLNADPSTGRTATPAGNWEIERVNMGLLCLLSGAGYTLVIEPSALSPQGEILALDGDLAAISIAVTVRADTLLILAIPDADDPTGARRTITLDREERLSREALIARERLKGSLKDIRLSEGCDSYPISGALWGSESIISISGINTLWMQSSLAT